MNEKTKQIVIAVIVMLFTILIFYVVFYGLNEATANSSGSIENSCSYPANWSWNRSVTYDEMMNRTCVWENGTFRGGS